ncbi:MAG: peptidase MA domain-containing protein, partial [Chloroflexi bacterium]|nr:peptidase MA domain-containing protein [Chloroflexota bacterium]
MIKKIGILATIMSLFLLVLGPAPLQAQSGLAILNASTVAEFPLKLNFSMSAKSDVNITDIRLHYKVDQESFADVTSEVFIEFTPATTVNAVWTWDMRKTGGLPTGASLEYWWTAKDSQGDSVASTPTRVRFDDNRYSWQSLTEGNVTIYWYEGKQDFANSIMTAAQQALTQLTQSTGAYLKKPIKIYVYADAQDLQGAMIFPQEWTGGVAFTNYGIINIGIGAENIVWGRRAIAHELTHLVVHQMTFNPYGGLPTWLDEGLATYNEGALDVGYANILRQAVTENKLITVRTLSSAFSTDAQKAYLSYAESYSLVEFLITTYGRDKMLELLTTFNQG